MTILSQKLLVPLAFVAMLLAIGISGCEAQQPPQPAQQQEEEEKVPVSVSLIDHTGPDVVVLSYFVDRKIGGTQGGEQCCVELPKKWRPGLTFELYWDYTVESEGSPPPQKRLVEVEEYKPEKLDTLYIHIFPSHRVKAIAYNRDFGSPFYPLPKEEWFNRKVNRDLLRNWKEHYYEMMKGRLIPDDDDWKWAAQWGLYKEEAMRMNNTPK